MIEVDNKQVVPQAIKPVTVQPVAQKEKPKLSIVDIKKQLTDRRKELLVFINDDSLLDRFIESVIEALYKNPELVNCDPDSLFMACKKAAKDGLLPDGHDAALTPYKGIVSYVPMIGGLYKKTHRTGQVKEIIVDVVYDCDKFQYITGDDPKISHEPDLRSVRQGVIAAYAIVKMKDGGVYREVITSSEIEHIKSKAKSTGVWNEWYAQQCKKTVYRRLAKRLPIYEALQNVIENDNEIYEETKLDKLEEKTNAATGQ